MIITDHFVFLHLHKSGGTFVNEFLLKFVPDARQIGYHLPRKLAPPAAASLPALGFVRNPWSYYVSWYSFQVRRREPNALFRILSNEGSLDFEHTVANMLDLGAAGKLLDRIVAALPPRYINRGLNVPGYELDAIRASGRGFYSFLYRHIYDGPGVMHIRRSDRLRRELPSMLVAVGQPVSAAMAAHLQDSADINTSDHVSYTNYYGAELRALVSERDAEVIAQHGFKFGD
ncbi:MAG TPA: hypothetical protein VGL34_21280 [Steroidobacteraceae bacterium]|jgi:hypothetical protein